MDWSSIDNNLSNPVWYATGAHHDAFRKLREEGPVHKINNENFEKSYWGVFSHKDILTVMNDEVSCSLNQVVGEARGFRAGRGLGLGRKRGGMGVSVHRQSPGLRVGPKPRAHSLAREGSPLPPCLSLFHGSADLRPAAETYPQNLGMGLWALSRRPLSA